MKRIFNAQTGAEIGITETSAFVTLRSEKVDYALEREEATGIRYKGVLYNLEGTEGVGAEITVRVEDYDAGDDALATALRTAKLENALCELDEELHGGE